MLDKKSEQAIEKTIKQMNGDVPLGKDINNMSIEEINKLEQDLKDTKEFIKMNGWGNELSDNVIKSLEIQIKKRKEQLSGN